MYVMMILEKWIAGVVVIFSLILQVHNVHYYNLDFGFDGKDHLEYVRWVAEKKSVPIPHEGWQFYQPPLYYIVASIFWSLGQNEVLAQGVNLLVFAGIGLILRQYNKSAMVLIAFLALPMVNYLVPLITNELMSGLFIVWGLVKVLDLLKKEEVKRKDMVLLGVIFTLGFYTKYTMLSLLPIFAIALFLVRKKLTNLWKDILTIGTISITLISPILIRNYKLYKTPIALTDSFYQFQQESEKRDWKFFSRMDWVINQDLFKSHHYSFWGGIWNTFWHDGQNAITPIVEFHKKAYVLFLLGFPLSVLALWGLLGGIWKENKKVAITLGGYTLLALASLAIYK